jgi:CheY-like chemotaxis protein
MAKKILIVDDDIEQIEFASTVLEENGYILISATNGVEGMEKVKSEKPDLILLDILMPEKSGISMYRDLRNDKESKDIPVIVVTGVGRGQRIEGRMMGQDPGIPAPEGLIQKPMEPSVILKLVNKLLSGSS